MPEQKRMISIAALAVFLAWSSAGYAEVYKYQDKNGRWHFSDKPPKSTGNKYGVASQSKTGKGNVSSDYQALLSNKYKPRGPVESATLAVVTVKSHLGSGSGFFVSDDCYIVTNRHVVRPTTTSSWKDSQENIEKEKARLMEDHRYIADERERLEIVKKDLAEYRDYIPMILH